MLSVYFVNAGVGQYSHEHYLQFLFRHPALHPIISLHMWSGCPERFSRGRTVYCEQTMSDYASVTRQKIKQKEDDCLGVTA